MKKLMILAMLCVLCTGVRATDYDYLVFTLNDGTTQTVSATGITITFSDSKLSVQSGSTTLATIALSSLSKMEFSNSDTSGLSTITTDRLATDNSTVIYDLNGRQLPKSTQLSRGIYILKRNGRTLKVQVK